MDWADAPAESISERVVLLEKKLPKLMLRRLSLTTFWT